MFIRGVFMHVKPRAVRSLRGRLRTRSFPSCEVKKASGTKSPWLPRACQSNGNQPLWVQKENADVYGCKCIQKCRRPRRRQPRKLLALGSSRFPIRLCTRLPRGVRHRRQQLSSFGEDGRVPPRWCPAKRNLGTRRNELANAYENHEAWFHSGVASSAVIALARGLPNTGGICGVCGGNLGRPGEPRR